MVPAAFRTRKRFGVFFSAHNFERWHVSLRFVRETLCMADFELHALYDALDALRRDRDLSWKAVADEVNRHRTFMRPIASSTITSLKQKRVGEGDGILQMLLWLRRTPESFVPGAHDPQSERFCRPELTTGQILRWDTRALHAALDERRRRESLTWADVARQIGRYTPGQLTTLARGGRTGFPHVMRIVRWLDRPAAAFTRIAAW
jgi:hypothetical protein